jgi:ABC-type thiamin/hydroxymethylpyrimidine transport system permease subunit
MIVALACATFGGVVGALATAAVQSQANPAAIAAAVEKVQDKSAETSLAAINSKLTTVSSRLASVPGLSAAIATDIYQLDSQSYVDSNALFNELKLVCQGEGTNSTIGSCAAVGDPSPPTPQRTP